MSQSGRLQPYRLRPTGVASTAKQFNRRLPVGSGFAVYGSDRGTTTSRTRTSFCVSAITFGYEVAEPVDDFECALNASGPMTEGDQIERGRLRTADGKRRREPRNLGAR